LGNYVIFLSLGTISPLNSQIDSHLNIHPANAKKLWCHPCQGHTVIVLDLLLFPSSLRHIFPYFFRLPPAPSYSTSSSSFSFVPFFFAYNSTHKALTGRRSRIYIYGHTHTHTVHLVYIPASINPEERQLNILFSDALGPARNINKCVATGERKQIPILNQRLWKEKIKRSTDGNDTAHHNNTIAAHADLLYSVEKAGPAKEEENGRRKIRNNNIRIIISLEM
jgi:hypothetical protein